MNQKKIGCLLKELRNEKGRTQEQVAEHFGVTNRTVSRWETGHNMPDLALIIEIADYYDISIRELLEGEREDEHMDNELKETVKKAAGYSNDEKIQLMKKLHFFAWIGIISYSFSMIIESTNLVENTIWVNVASFCSGFAFGILILTVIYTSSKIMKFLEIKNNI